ncbi:DNA-binding protein [Candidatus Woesearchaeota archaeon CG10_big_fil_rev_8_21_14_0_10_34_12]|nr:MAG: DNA-binding protein [Candidatus Woesearchaeota archaeon CG10_big_fil_rev_8_21_14_0_10_34_12]
MKELNFLKKLKRKRVIDLVESSEEMKLSYLTKAENCLKSAKILFQSQLYENSTSEAYYCMYNSLLSLLFKIGIKSENHSASIILFGRLFEDKELLKILSWVKEERVDKQYYVETQQIVKVTKESCDEMIIKAEDFLLKMKLIISELNNEKISSARKDFNELVG